jgi:DNA-binding winged helix-turn-helix (wHTH) protein/tetratricopeptide (TPR) repeat protein
VQESSNLAFGPFRLDLTRDRLWREQEVVELRAKPLAVLRYLVEHAGQVVTRDELQKQVWTGIYVTKTALRVCVREIRLALGDDATAPQYIETVGRQGYRFIAPISTTAPPVISDQWSVVNSDKEGTQPAQLGTGNWPLATRPQHLTPYFVGRERELLQLRQWFESTLAGQRQCVFVTGEAGIGKTALINTFLHQTHQTGPVWLAHGQCIEQYGVGIPYLPLLDALGQLWQEPEAARLVLLFERVAPLWLAQLPALPSQKQRNAPGLNVAEATPARMLREMAEMLAVLATERPLILVLEDLHWSDAATVETLAYLARRRDPARLLILGTYRPADIVVGEPPLRRLRQELLAHELCKELRLELLTEKEVRAYVTQRLAGNPLATELSPIIYQRTDGNALFVVTLVDYLLRQGLLQKAEQQRLTPEAQAALQTELPEGLLHLILKQVEGLTPEEQHVLEGASVAGVHFTAAEVAAAVQGEAEHIETVCDGLVKKRQFIEADEGEEWPDGTLTAGYRFLHAVYHQGIGSRVGQTREVRQHRLIGDRLEAGYGARAGEIASHLATHFEQGRDRRAVHYRRLAAEQALRQNAYQEVYLHSTTGLSLLKTFPDTPERKRLELGLRQLVSATLYTNREFMDTDPEENLRRAWQLCHELEDETTLVSILVGLGRLQMIRANRAEIAKLEQEEERLAERVHDAQLLVQLHTQLATIATFRGVHARAAEHYQHVFRHHDPQAPALPRSSFGGDPLMVASFWPSLSLSLAGKPDQGWSRITQALAHAEGLNQPLLFVTGLVCAAIMKLLRGDYDEAWQLVPKIDALAGEHHFALYRIAGILLQGCIAVQSGALAEGIAGITTGLSQYHAIGAQHLVPFFLSFLAEGYRQQDKLDEARQVVVDALNLTETNFDTFWEAELYRQKGELLLTQEGKNQKSKGKSQKSKMTDPRPLTPDPQGEAEACFLQAIDIARQQGAKLLELRAVISLVRLRQRQAQDHATRNTQHESRLRLDEARAMLSEVYNWFTEGFDTVDLQTARTLLATWSTSPQPVAQPAKQK